MNFWRALHSESDQAGPLEWVGPDTAVIEPPSLTSAVDAGVSAPAVASPLVVCSRIIVQTPFAREPSESIGVSATAGACGARASAAPGALAR